jgi:UDP-glucose 4-epimerase
LGRTLAGRRVVVAGGAGFVGSHLCDAIAKETPERLVIIDDFSLGKTRNIRALEGKKEVGVYRQDANDYEALRGILSRENPEVVFNLAVIPLPKSLELPWETIETNVRIATNFCELQRKGAFQTLLHCSSSEAYGSALYVPMDEKHPEKPLTPYAASKIACDHIVTSYWKTFGTDVAIARPFNAYGPRQNEGSYAGVIPLTILRILSGQKPVIFGDGLQTRDYTFVEDTVAGILGVSRAEGARGQLVNIASGKEVTIKHIINLIVSMMGYKGEVEHKPARPGDVRRHRGDISLARRLFKYEVEWYRKES